ncbi:hypothetical protein AAG570_002470 [Ranatra chinensis]|uniref:Mid1-interacting protein 1 n=1 Tax=Ranatra chinensis TaxID=642074 RepID=A0ABD0YQE0_9HEMI
MRNGKEGGSWRGWRGGLELVEGSSLSSRPVSTYVYARGMLTVRDFNRGIVICDRITNDMDSNRHCVRRVVPHKEAEFSSQSIMKAMEKFVDAVRDMDETILVPSRLMDLRVGDDGDNVGFNKRSSEREGLKSTDLFRLYSMVNCVRNQLMWGANDCPAPEEEAPHQQQRIGGGGNGTALAGKGHVRRPSTASVASTNSAVSTMSDTDSEAGNENDSGIEAEGDPASALPAYTHKMEECFRKHLYGLHRSLQQMTDAATYLTKRYQNDIGATL